MASNKSKTPGPIQVVVVLMLTVLAFYFGNRFGQVFDFNTMEITDGALVTVNSIVAAPAAISTASVPMLYAIGLAITVLIVWLYTFMYAGNYRYGEEAGSAKWGTLKEGVAFKDQTDPSNNLLFTKNYGLALKKPKFDLEHDRNLNVMVIGGSGSGKTRNYVKPNLMQLNASYFLTDPKGTSLPECGYLFRDNGYRIRAFNTIEFNKSMHYNPLKYVKTDADILSFVNCLISNTNGDKQSGGDPFWENSERLLYTALIALLRDWFPPEDYSLDGLLTLLSMAEAKENDENFKSPLDMIFDEIETGKVYERNPFYQGPSTSSSYADAESDRMAISENTTDEFTWQSSLMERNNDGLSPAREGGLTSDQDFALANYKMFKVAAGKTLKSIIISCNVRMAPMRIEQVRELLKYDEMTGTILSNPTDEIYIIDRAGEYTGISSRYGGVTYNFAVDSDTYLNPFDTVSVESLSPDAQLAFKIDAMLAQAGASAAEAGRDLGEEDQSIITRCVQEAFFDARQRGDQPPLLEDFYNKLLEQPEPEAKTIALRYERFVTGTQSFFNHQSNVDFKSRIVDFNLKDLPDSMLVFGLINVCEAVRNRMYFNAKRGVRTWLYVEEVQSLFAYPTVLNYFSRFSNEGRKFGLLLTCISQNAVAMLKNKAAQNLVLNSDFLLLLKQSPLDRAEWVRLLGLSEQEEEFIDESVEPGDGLLIAGGARVPIRGKFPSGNVLYDLFSTNPNEAADKKRMQEFAAREKSRLG